MYCTSRHHSAAAVVMATVESAEAVMVVLAVAAKELPMVCNRRTSIRRTLYLRLQALALSDWHQLVKCYCGGRVMCVRRMATYTRKPHRTYLHKLPPVQ
jgi:hypothetical protein